MEGASRSGARDNSMRLMRGGCGLTESRLAGEGPSVSLSGRDAGGQRADRFARRDVLRYVLRVPSDAGEDVRHRGVEEEETNEVQPRLARDDATNVLGISGLIEDGEMDP
jgi:hypothetical protein